MPEYEHLMSQLGGVSDMSGYEQLMMELGNAILNGHSALEHAGAAVSVTEAMPALQAAQALTTAALRVAQVLIQYENTDEFKGENNAGDSDHRGTATIELGEGSSSETIP